MILLYDYIKYILAAGNICWYRGMNIIVPKRNIIHRCRCFANYLVPTWSFYILTIANLNLYWKFVKITYFVTFFKSKLMQREQTCSIRYFPSIFLGYIYACIISIYIICIRVYASKYIVCLSLSLYIYICVYTHIYIYIYIQHICVLYMCVCIMCIYNVVDIMSWKLFCTSVSFLWFVY